MSTTLSANPENGAIRAINTLYLGGLVLDILSALLAFLTTRWLERLAEREKDLVEIKFSYQNLNADEKVLITPRPMRPWKTRDRQWCYYTWLSLSLFVPLPLLIFGVMCMIVGICTYAWTQQPVVVGSLVTLASVVPLLFIVGDFSIGRERDKREKLITRLSEMQGNW
ncbi:hypothetical protein BJV74DRAFT_775036 [Russula compacta]|nr:hypothetical protein BJV74DRAFT_775036 [Russula compacta]